MIKWHEISAARYDEMLCVLPPAVWIAHGFLIGEPTRHDDDGVPMFAAFVTHLGKFYEGSAPMTAADFRALDPQRVLIDRTASVLDVEVIGDDGWLVGLHPLTAAASAWIAEHVASEPWMWVGAVLWIDGRMAAPVLDGMRDAGLIVVGGPAASHRTA